MYLLDTHVLLWWLGNDALLSVAACEQICNPKHTVFVSAASAWEISIKKALGKLTMPDGLSEVVMNNGFEPLMINLDHAQLAGSLPKHHADPFDRMLIAQAKIEGLTIITHDPLFKPYEIKLMLC